MARAVGDRCFWVHSVAPLRGEPVVIVDSCPSMFIMRDVDGCRWMVDETTGGDDEEPDGDRIVPLAAVDTPAPAVKPRVGERWRFVVPDRADEIVEILDAGFNGYTGFFTADGTEIIVDADGRLFRGTLEPLPPPAPKTAPRPKQHDEISLDEWRHKIGRMRWP